MNKSFIVQALISLLVGAGVFYISAPHSFGLGIYLQEPIYAGISLGISLVMLIPIWLIFFKRKKRYYGAAIIFSLVGIGLVSYFYPADERTYLASSTVKQKVYALLINEGMPPNRDFRIQIRQKLPFDLFAEHRWEVVVYGNNPINYQVVYYTERFGEGELVTHSEVDWSKLNN